MNTTPDETRLALWLDDELDGPERDVVEAWAATSPGQIEAREEIRRLRNLVAASIPAEQEPPYPEFFNSRVRHAIERAAVAADDAPQPRFRWRALLMPLASCAGMVAAFALGLRSQPGPPEIDVTGAPKAIPVDPILYTPEKGVKAEWFTSPEAAATVIVLQGVEAIPDETDFSKTVSLPPDEETNRAMADRESTITPQPQS